MRTGSTTITSEA